MKKRCSNSKCRKFFSATTSNGRCPYCGKLYSGVSISEPKTKTIKKSTPVSAVSYPSAKVSASTPAKSISRPVQAQSNTTSARPAQAQSSTVSARPVNTQANTVSSSPVAVGEYCIVRTATEEDKTNMTRKVILDDLCIEIKRDFFAKTSPIGNYNLDKIQKELKKIPTFNWNRAWYISYLLYRSLIQCEPIELYYYSYSNEAGEIAGVKAIENSPKMSTTEWLNIPGSLWSPLP